MPETTPSAAEVRAAVAEVVGRIAEGSSSEAPHTASDRGQGSSTGGDTPISELAIGADHGGYHLKEKLAADLRDRGLNVRDCGTRSTDSVDYPDIAHAVAFKVATGECQVGIVIDGAGIGSAIAANKLPGVRAATCWDLSSARNSREHNYANVLSLGAGLLGESLARQIVDAWLATPYGESRHGRRVAKITELEQRYGTRLA
ncbi:MAG: ribose 5-phosphate isomerase B [Nitriliruptoraceae bacterium]